MQERAKRRKQNDVENITRRARRSLRPEAGDYGEFPSLVLNQTHPLSDLIYRRARYKVLWGGRGSAKSWGVAEALIRIAAAKKLRVLCAREYQNSMRESSYKLLKDTTDRLGLLGFFRFREDSIVSQSGSEFIFKGLHNNDNSIRSTEGIDVCWVEEAHSVSNASWRVLLPTIRKAGSEVWMTFNLEDEADPAYKMFVEKERPRSIVHKLNFDSNPYFPAELREEMETDKANDYQLYEHIWLGMPLRISDAMVFGGKYRVADFPADLWKNAERPFYGLDFGYAQDPCALIRYFPIERDDFWAKDGKRRLFIEHEAYDTGVELDEMPEWMEKVPGVRDWPIKADSARPETISHLRRRGFNVSAAEKWEGCVKDGITHLRGFHEIVIHERCTNMAKEARLYRYKVDDRQRDEKGRPMVLPVAVDKHNHAWDAVRYGLDGYIMRSGDLGIWQRLGK